MCSLRPDCRGKLHQQLLATMQAVSTCCVTDCSRKERKLAFSALRQRAVCALRRLLAYRITCTDE
jgi:hypothetical protein